MVNLISHAAVRAAVLVLGNFRLATSFRSDSDLYRITLSRYSISSSYIL